MAISKLGGSNKWVQIATSSPTSGSTVSFTSISEYNELCVIYKQLKSTGAGQTLSFRLNNDSTSGNYARIGIASNGEPAPAASEDGCFLGGLDGTLPVSGIIKIKTPTQLVKEIEYSHISSIGALIYNSNGLYFPDTAIDRIDFYTAGAFASGKITVYGRN